MSNVRISVYCRITTEDSTADLMSVVSWRGGESNPARNSSTHARCAPRFPHFSPKTFAGFGLMVKLNSSVFQSKKSCGGGRARTYAPFLV